MIIKNIIFDFGRCPYGLESKSISIRMFFNSEEEMDFFLDNIATLKWNAEQDRGRSFQEATEILQNQYPEFSKEIALYYKSSGQ